MKETKDALRASMAPELQTSGWLNTPQPITLDTHKFGHVSDLTVGFSIGALLSEEMDEAPDVTADPGTDAGNAACDEDGCSI